MRVVQPAVFEVGGQSGGVALCLELKQRYRTKSQIIRRDFALVLQVVVNHSLPICDREFRSPTKINRADIFPGCRIDDA